MEPWTGGQLHPVLSDLAMLTTLYNDVLTSPAPPCQQMWPSLSALRVTGSPSSLLYPCDVSVLNLERRRLHRRQNARSRRPAPFFSRRSVAERRQPPSKQPSSQAAKQPSSQAASDAELPGRGLRTAHASGSALLPRHISALSTCHRDSSKDALAQAAVDIRMSAAERLKQQPITCGEQRCKAPLCLHRGIPRHVQRNAAWSFSVQTGVKLKTAVAPGRQQERC